MNRLSGRVRVLCLLALLQVVGGPLVLVGVATLGKVMVKETAQHGVVAGISRAVESEEWLRTCDVIVDAVTDHADTKAPNGKSKEKDLKSKMMSIAWAGTPVVAGRLMQQEPPGGDPVPLISAWPNGPPVPPPRWV